MTRKLTTLAAVLALTTGCVGNWGRTADDYREVLPDERILVNLPIDTDGAQRDGQWSDYYLLTAEVTDSVNGLIRGVLVGVDTVTDYPPSWADSDENTAVWGPWTDGPLDPNNIRLVVHYDDTTDMYLWAAELQPKNTDDTEEWFAVIAGEVDPGATHEVNSGRFWMDFDTLATLDPTSHMHGMFGTEYAIDTAGVAATAGFTGFRDGMSQEIDASYDYSQVHGGDGHMDLAILHDLGITATPEMHLVRSRWQATGAGRSDAYLSQGDLGDQVYTASECWDTSFAAVYHVNNYEPKEEGDLSLCAFDSPEHSDEDPELL